MDSLHNSTKRIPKLKSLSGSASPINTRLSSDSTLIRYLRGGSPITFSGGNGDAFSSSEISSKSSGGSNRRFGRSFSPLSSIENVISQPVYGTPVNVVDEDVLVMDGVLVESSSGGRVSRSISSGSGGSSSNSASSPGIRAFRTELCRSWEDFGQCRYGSKCQFAHGKEEVRPSQFTMEKKSEAPPFKSYSEALASSSYSPKFTVCPPMMTVPDLTAIPHRPEYKRQISVVVTKPKSSKSSSPMSWSQNSSLIKPEDISQDWSPLDDGLGTGSSGYSGINQPSRKDVDQYVHRVLYGPSTRKRLPVFTEFFPQ